MSGPLPVPVVAGTRPSVLAPMQDVTTTGFMRVIGRRGAPDWFVTEYFRVHESSTPEKHIVDSVVNHGTGRPVFAQLIGEDTPHMLRTIRELGKLPIAGIDLNMGCPAPKVYRKNVGGGLLRDPAKIDELIGAMRQEIPGLFTVKMRIGFDGQERFDEILAIVAMHRPTQDYYKQTLLEFMPTFLLNKQTLLEFTLTFLLNRPTQQEIKQMMHIQEQILV